ncbi:MAG TPA: hypothetical protein VKI62_10015 [Bacteroidota bacterium]|nr:hypothetical protein [Bacteroidota bacterium]
MSNYHEAIGQRIDNRRVLVAKRIRKVIEFRQSRGARSSALWTTKVNDESILRRHARESSRCY